MPAPLVGDGFVPLALGEPPLPDAPVVLDELVALLELFVAEELAFAWNMAYVFSAVGFTAKTIPCSQWLDPHSRQLPALMQV